MSNYPDSTWEGDPRAPWNRPECMGDYGLCEGCGRCEHADECRDAAWRLERGLE